MVESDRTEVVGWSDSDDSAANSRRASLDVGTHKTAEGPAEARPAEAAGPSTVVVAVDDTTKPKKTAQVLWTEGRRTQTPKSAADLWKSGRPQTPEPGGLGIPLEGLLQQTAKRGLEDGENSQNSPKKKTKVKAAGNRHYCVLLRSDSLSG
jgi:hypothetical protein